MTDVSYSVTLDNILDLKYFKNSALMNNHFNPWDSHLTDFSGSLYDTNSFLFTPTYPNFFGSAIESKVRPTIMDILNSNSFSVAQYDLSNMLRRPPYGAHGMVWKVVVDGYDSQDEFDKLPDLGVGRHKFEVYFSKQMNRDATPMVAMGVRPPYTQIAIAEDPEWRSENVDGDVIDVYSAYLTIKGSDAYDGLNRIYVADAEDNEYFFCPIENSRFNVNVQSAGSMSAGFMAEAGVGKDSLTWENPEDNFDDMLGYNVYRYILDENRMPGDTIRINDKLLTIEEFVDYDIVPGTTYNYYYKVLRTSLEENSSSRVVSATPRAAGKGDANASGNVDVADVVTEVNYMVGRDPKPFIFDAADVNDDDDIDILDVVGTVNLIMAPESKSSIASIQSVATYTIEDGILCVDSPVELAGVQAEVIGKQGLTEISVLSALRGMENTGEWVSDESYRFLAFSLIGKTLESGRHALLIVGDAKLDRLILVDASGNSVMAIEGASNGISSIVLQQMKTPSPNPFVDVINVPVLIGTSGNHTVELSLVDLSGAKMYSYNTVLGFGEHIVTLQPTSVPNGFYLLVLTVDGNAVQTHKVIKK